MPVELWISVKRCNKSIVIRTESTGLLMELATICTIRTGAKLLDASLDSFHLIMLTDFRLQDFPSLVHHFPIHESFPLFFIVTSTTQQHIHTLLCNMDNFSPMILHSLQVRGQVSFFLLFRFLLFLSFCDKKLRLSLYMPVKYCHSYITLSYGVNLVLCLNICVNGVCR